MDEYYFIYKNSLGYWSQCTNPVFIAEHKCCKAFKKETTNLQELLNSLNN